MMKRRGYLGLLVVIVCMALTMSACGKKTEETTNKVNFWASSHIWLREVQDARWEKYRIRIMFFTERTKTPI